MSFAGGAPLAKPAVLDALMAQLANKEWVVYAKRPLGGPEQVLEYLPRHTHRVAIANRRLVSCSNGVVRFRWRDYRAEGQWRVMSLASAEFPRRP